ncbi:hypothetical protein DYH10_00655 [Candidatus Saccharibacteria bacterium CPR2]|nr:hypothetical protein [Candidatus Saccharibacteria bacterium CPR2]
MVGVFMSVDLGTSADLITLLVFVWPVIVWLVGFFVYLKFFRKKEKRLFKNIKRPVAIVPSASTDMAHETLLIRNTGFFDVDLKAADSRSADLIDNEYRLIVLAYEPTGDSFGKLFDTLKSKQIPLIIYSSPGVITKADIKRIQGYSLHTISNTPLRLISDIFAIMSTYPEEQN